MNKPPIRPPVPPRQFLDRSRKKPYPFGPKPKPKSLSKRKPMTIAIGLICREGLLIATDSEESAGLYKRDVDKIYGVTITAAKHSATCVVAGAGDGNLIEMFNASIGRKILDSKSVRTPLDFPSIETMIGDSIADIFDQNIAPIPSHLESPELKFLIGVAVLGRTKLYRVEPRRQVVPIRWEHKHASVGIGYHYADPILDTLHSKILFMADSADLGIYILRRVKIGTKYCGGQSQIILLANDASVHGYTQGWPAYEHVNHMETWSSIMDALAAQLVREVASNNNVGIKNTLRLIGQHSKTKPQGTPDRMTAMVISPSSPSEP